MEISISSNQKRIDIDLPELQKKTELVLEGLGCDPTTMISIALVDAGAMAELNFKYRGKAGPTNVLSFRQNEAQEAILNPNLLGDVVICTDRAADDARDLGYSNDEMVLYLLIHGVLHLSGYSHESPHDAASMEERVEQIFKQFYPPPD